MILACSLDLMLCEFSRWEDAGEAHTVCLAPWQSRGMECAAAAWKVMCFQPLLSPDGRGNECESWQDLLFWWIWPCCWRPAGRGWREVTQGLLLEGISFIRLLGEGRLALECTSLSTRRRKERVIARSLPWPSRLRESSEREGGKKKDRFNYSSTCAVHLA